MRWRRRGLDGWSSAMFRATRPTPRDIDRFLDESRSLPLSYGPAGLTQQTPSGFNVDEMVVSIGRGQADFDRAKVALAAWKHFDIGWVRAIPSSATTDPGTVVA